MHLRIIAIILGLFLLNSCKLVENPVEPAPTIPTRDVRYVVTMTSSSANSNPIISYTNSFGNTSEVNALNLDVTIAIDSGTTVNLAASCVGYYSAVAGNSSAGIEMKLYVADSLAADSSIIKTDNLNAVSASASVSAQIK